MGHGVPDGKQDTIYVVGGRLNENVTVRDLYVYNIPTNTWTVAPAAPINASDNCAGSVGGKVDRLRSISHVSFRCYNLMKKGIDNLVTRVCLIILRFCCIHTGLSNWWLRRRLQDSSCKLRV